MSKTSAARPLLRPFVPVYRLGLALREFELRSGLKPVRRLRWPVVSIGNLSTGGSGKTPLAIALAKALTARGLHVDVLSRGYGRRTSVPARVDPNGTVADFGDEPLLIAREAKVPVYVAAERYQAGSLAEADAERSAVLKGHGFSRAEISDKSVGPLGPEGSFCIHLLDDGFQHRQLARDVDILLLSRADLNDHLLPAGNLREALHAAERADVIAIPADEADLEAVLKSSGWRGTVWRLHRRMEIPPRDGPVAAFCGIARPDQFFRGLKSAGVRVSSRIVFPDHHNYTAADLARIESAARAAGATTLLTTEKDRVRLGAPAEAHTTSLRVETVKLHVEIENTAAAIDWTVKRLQAFQTQQS